MTAYPIPNPFSQWVDTNGLPLTGAYIYIGEPNEDPETNPIAVYEDADLTIPLAQPIRTTGGYLAGSGTPINGYPSETPYSIRVRRRNGNSPGTQIFYLPEVHDEIADFFATIAGGAGAGLVGFSQAETYADGTVGERLKNEIHVTDAPYNAKGDDSTDNAAAFAAAIAGAVARGARLIIPPGTYRSSQPFNFTDVMGGVEGLGNPTLKYTGSGNYCVLRDAGNALIKYGGGIENLTIEGSGAANQDGLRIYNVVHGIYRNLRVRNVSRDAYSILGDAVSTYDNCIVSANEAAFSTTPARGFFLDASTYAGNPAVTTACTFINPIAERTKDYGIYLLGASANTFTGGTSEAIRDAGGVGIGVYVAVAATQNRFTQTFCEANEGGDLEMYGDDNFWDGSTANSAGADPTPESIFSIRIRPGAAGNTIANTLVWQLRVYPGAVANSIIRCTVRNEFLDEGDNTYVEGLLNPFVSVDRQTSIRIGNKADPNPLAWDWYEERSFTPTIAGSTTPGTADYVIQNGRMIRNGGSVEAWGRVSYTSFAGGVGALSAVLTGLPNAKLTGDIVYPATIVANNLTFTGQLVAQMPSGSPRIILYSQATNAALSGVGLDSAADIAFHVKYEAA